MRGVPFHLQIAFMRANADVNKRLSPRPGRPRPRRTRRSKGRR
jgi:hypothetical protein